MTLSHHCVSFLKIFIFNFLYLNEMLKCCFHVGKLLLWGGRQWGDSITGGWPKVILNGLNGIYSTSPSKSLIGYSLNLRNCSLVWLKSLWQIRFFNHQSVTESPLWLTLLWRSVHGKNRSPFSAQLITPYCLVLQALFDDKYFCFLWWWMLQSPGNPSAVYRAEFCSLLLPIQIKQEKRSELM